MNNIQTTDKEKNLKKVIRKQSKTIKTLIIICVLLVAIIAVGSVYFLTSDKSGDNSGNVTEEVVTIKTPYCDLFYPGIWGNEIKIETKEKNDVYIVDVYAEIDKYPEQKLFSVYFNAEEGDKIGEITHKDKKISVSVESYKSENTDEWSEEEKNKLASMQENINFIIDCLMETEGFSN